MVVRNVSVIIPTYNRPELLATILGAYISEPEVCEVIVVDDGSTLDYGSVIQLYRQRAEEGGVELRFAHTDRRRGAPAARNLGLSLLGPSEYVLFSDDDVLLSRGAIRKAIGKMDSLGADIVGARVVPCTVARDPAGSFKIVSTWSGHLQGNVFNLLLLKGFYDRNPGCDIAGGCPVVRGN